MTGVKAHTIRIWEKRYHIINPQRTTSNIRFYQDDDVKLLINVANLNRKGYKISRIAQMDPSDIAQEAAEDSIENYDKDGQLDALTIALVEMDGYKFDRIFNRNLIQMGFEKTIENVILPFLSKLNVLWITGSIHPVQEKFIGLLIRQKICAAIDQLGEKNNTHFKKFLLFLPLEDTKELSVLYLHYILRVQGYQVVNIGCNVALEDLRQACILQHPDYILTFQQENQAASPKSYVLEAHKVSPGIQIFISGEQIAFQEISTCRFINIFQTMSEMVLYLKDLSLENPMRYIPSNSKH